MGIYDRDYYREDNRPPRRSKYQSKQGIFSQFSAVAVLIVLNVILYFANGIFCQDTNALTELLMMKGDTLRYPLEWYRLLTYGFTHDPRSINHILFNMIALFFFGPPVERHYGKMEFFSLYFVAAFVGGLAWGIGNFDGPASMLGASGAVVAVVLLFCLNYPNATVFLMGIIPMPAWLLGIMFIGMDTMGMLGKPVGGQGNIAHSVHLVGAAIALVYFFGRIRFTQIFSPIARLFGRSEKGLSSYYERNNSSSPNITVSTPSPERRPLTPMEEEVDRILRKISTYGAESLTDREREALQNASRLYQDRMKK